MRPSRRAARHPRGTRASRGRGTGCAARETGSPAEFRWSAAALTPARLRRRDGARSRRSCGRAGWPRRRARAWRGYRGGRALPPPNAAMASRSASRTEMASIRGGSPTALLPQTTPGSVARVRKSTWKSSGSFGPRGQFVGGRAGGQQAALVIPQQLFQREPAERLE